MKLSNSICSTLEPSLPCFARCLSGSQYLEQIMMMRTSAASLNCFIKMTFAAKIWILNACQTLNHERGLACLFLL